MSDGLAKPEVGTERCQRGTDTALVQEAGTAGVTGWGAPVGPQRPYWVPLPWG